MGTFRLICPALLRVGFQIHYGGMGILIQYYSNPVSSILSIFNEHFPETDSIVREAKQRDSVAAGR